MFLQHAAQRHDEAWCAVAALRCVTRAHGMLRWRQFIAALHAFHCDDVRAIHLRHGRNTRIHCLILKRRTCGKGDDR